MIRDRREEILARLRMILETVPGIKKAARNLEEISGSDRPAIVMHDAAESDAGLANRLPKSKNDMMVLSPQIYILLGARALVVGSKISELRMAVLPVILKDEQLQELTGGSRGNGDIHYTGCGLDTTSGENREARLELSFEFTYPLLMTELA